MQELVSAAEDKQFVALASKLLTRASVRSRAGGPVFWVIVSGAVLILAIGFGTWGAVATFRERDIQRSERELQSRVQLLALQFDRQLGEIEALQNAIGSELEQTVKTAEQFKSFVKTEGYHRFLQNKLVDPTDFAAIDVFDSNANIINSTAEWPVFDLNASSREYFKLFRRPENAIPVLIKLGKSKISSDRTLVLARKIAGPHGELLGVITRSIPLGYFEKYFSAVVLPEGSITLLHQDGTLFARFPHAENAVGQSFAGAPLVTRNRPTEAFETSHFISPVDGIERVGSAKNFDHYPLAILATTTVSAALTDWRDETRTLIALVGLAALIISLLLVFIVRHLKEQHRRLDVAVNNMSQGLMLFDASERLVISNKRYTELFGLSPDVIRPGCSLREVLQHRKDRGSLVSSVDKYCEVFREASKSGKPKQSAIQLPDGRWMKIAIQPLSRGGWVSTIEDVTDQRRSEERNIRLALYDTLTGLPNRAFFLEHLQTELDKCSTDSRVAVCFLDADEFKAVNDTLGHLVGDQLLKALASRIQSCLQTGEFVARLGGDEFAIVVSQAGGREHLLAIVERIYSSIREPYDFDGHHLIVDSSIGIAFSTEDGMSCEEIVRNADLAMYEAKSAGRRTYRFFEANIVEKAKERQFLEAGLREALNGGNIEVHYQPIVDLWNNEIVGCEALARWSHPSRGFVSPADFIPIAERSGLIEQLGEYVLSVACREASMWPPQIKIAVNVSPVQFRNGLFALKVVSALAQSGLSPQRLELEITEAVLIGDDEVALKSLHELRAIGVRIALDDFGTGYSSLSYLRRFPFDKIKIDRCFINDMTVLRGSCGIVRAIVALASEYDMTTTAEGVETQQQAAILRELHCVEGQGFLFSPAMSAIQINEKLNSASRKCIARESSMSAIGYCAL